jgi:hypothetical protein
MGAVGLANAKNKAIGRTKSAEVLAVPILGIRLPQTSALIYYFPISVHVIYGGTVLPNPSTYSGNCGGIKD